MDKSLLIGAVLGIGVATAGGVVAGYQLLKDEPPAIEQSAPAQERAQAAQPAVSEACVPGEPRDDKRIAGTVIGALVGGAVGRDIGDRDITTAAGAAAGALAGREVQERFQENRAEKSGC